MRVGIVGLGTMGSGIAQVVAQNGHEVVAIDASKTANQDGMERIRKFMTRGIELGKTTSKDMEAVFDNIHTSLDYEDFGNCELIIEAATENLSIKQDIFSRLEAVVMKNAVLATNTSGIAVNEIAKALSDPNRLIGLHFFNPAQLMPLVEIVRPLGVSDSTVSQMRAFCEGIGKEPVVTKDRPGFLVNRLLIPYLNQAANSFDGGLATAEDIDVAVELGLGYPMGPLRLMDQIGLDVHLNATESIYEQTYIPEFRPPQILKEYVNTGRLGKKTKSGFYSY